VTVTEVFVDTVGDPDMYQRKLQGLFAHITPAIQVCMCISMCVCGSTCVGLSTPLTPHIYPHTPTKLNQVTVTKKADSLFKVCSCASIAAKVKIIPTSRKTNLSRRLPVLSPNNGTAPFSHLTSPTQTPIHHQVTRDRVISGWTWEETFPQGPPPTSFGSGYPSDQRTADWLAAHSDAVFGFPSLIRFSWAPARDHMEKHCVPVVWEHEEDDDPNALPPGTASIEAFIKRPAAPAAAAAPAAGGKKARKRAKYFSQRQVEVVGSF
jgi:hypothetical protein